MNLGLTLLSLVIAIGGFTAYGWASGYRDAGRKPLLRPGLALATGVVFMWLAVEQLLRGGN